MSILGAHMSISGGLWRAVERGAAVGCDCVQLFTGNPRAFPGLSTSSEDGKFSAQKNDSRRAKPIPAAEAEKFRNALAENAISHPIAHDSYLINLASPDPVLWRKSLAAFLDELHRAELLGIPYVVTHPGAFTESDENAGLRRIVRALDEIHAQTRELRARCLLETTAGQGTSLGWRFEQLAAILDGVKEPDRLGICFDTCHVFAAGYSLGTKKEYAATMKAFDKLIGVRRIKAFHLNDSRLDLGSRVDRHEHIGRGRMGLEPFRMLLNDRRFAKVPMYLETPKGSDSRGDWDDVNLAALRGLIAK
jgi:deoxyribonuclease IV